MHIVQIYATATGSAFSVFAVIRPLPHLIPLITQVSPLHLNVSYVPLSPRPAPDPGVVEPKGVRHVLIVPIKS
jgi:hypothetical protein